MFDNHGPPENPNSSDSSPDARDEAREIAGEVIRRMLIWIADAPTLLDRGLRATVALHCLRPDLIDGSSLTKVGDEAARTRGHVHLLSKDFRLLMGDPVDLR